MGFVADGRAEIFAMTAALSHAELSHVIGCIYDCTLDPSRWESTLDALRSLVHCRSAQLALVDLRQHRFLIQKNLGLEPQWLGLQGKYLPEITNFAERHLDGGLSMDQPLVTSRLASAERYAASPFFQEWCRPQGYIDVVQINLIRTPTRISGLALGRHETEGILEDSDIELMRLLVPHVRRAVTISNVLDVQAIEKARLAETLDTLKLGVVLANEDSRILHANHAAMEMMRDGGPLRDHHGVLRAEGTTASAEIKTAIGLAARNECSIGGTGLAVRLTDDDKAPLVAHVLPLAGGEVRSRLEPAAVAAVFINPEDDDAASATVLSTTFGLTPAETRVLVRVLKGSTVAEAAASLGVAPTTVRTHLDSIFSKTGVSRQSELIRLAAQIAPPARM
jgi:DNA-binding CsgD family transcriptional regulator/PAS domain-containing protein